MTADEPKVRIFMNTNAKMSRGKFAAHAVHAALIAAGVHPDMPVVVLGASLADIEQMATIVHDAGRTELEPGTLTAGTDWAPATGETRRRLVFEGAAIGWDAAVAAIRYDDGSPVELTTNVNPYRKASA